MHNLIGRPTSFLELQEPLSSIRSDGLSHQKSTPVEICTCVHIDSDVYTHILPHILTHIHRVNAPFVATVLIVAIFTITFFTSLLFHIFDLISG